MLNIVTAKQMRAIDRWAIDEMGIPGIVLMENAGTTIVRRLAEIIPDLSSKKICEILKVGLENTLLWHHMNSYHFSFLYDVLVRFIFNYNHDIDKERINSLPELEALPIYFGNFLSNYFFDYSFKVKEDHFNSLTHKQKLTLGYNCPCLFGVINGLIPTREEMALKDTQDFPYSIFV